MKAPLWRGFSRVEGRASSLRGPAFISSASGSRSRDRSAVSSAWRRLLGVDGVPVEVEVRISSQLPRIDIVGLPEAAVRESAARVRAAIGAVGAAFPDRRVTVNLAPASLRKSGAGLDLAIAVGMLGASGALGDAASTGSRSSASSRSTAACGRCAARSRSRSRRATPAAAPDRPAASAAEAALAPDLDVLAAHDLARSGPAPARGSAAAAAPGRRTSAPSPRIRRISPTCAVRSAPSARSRSPPPAATRCCCAARRAPARPCSRSGCRACCRRSPSTRRSR